jgi:hypothetical protein
MEWNWQGKQWIRQRDQTAANTVFPSGINDGIFPDGAFGCYQNFDDFGVIAFLEPLDSIDDFRWVFIFHWLTIQFSIDARIILQKIFL